jgi:hypothetical protein
MDDRSDQIEPEAEAQEGQPTQQRTVERLLADLRDPTKLDLAVLDFRPPADTAHIRRLLLEGYSADSYPQHYAGWLIAALRRVQQVGVLGRSVFVQVPQAYPGVHPAAEILARFPHVEVTRWEPSSEGNEPVITAVFRFAPHPLAPCTRVEFTIEYMRAIDGTDNLGYVVDCIEEEEARGPQGI